MILSTKLKTGSGYTALSGRRKIYKLAFRGVVCWGKNGQLRYIYNDIKGVTPGENAIVSVR